MLDLLKCALIFLKIFGCKSETRFENGDRTIKKCLPVEECPTLSWLPHSDLSFFQNCGEITLTNLGLELFMITRRV